ncbi:hypothetical protein EV424DRAFT_1542185 [Suillus variegatus]|nr:hypothetical protein EV424DRAFT_1542185 [Suillus variegatus]
MTKEDCSQNPKESVPWKEVIPRQEGLIPPLYLPEGRELQEPSRMTRHKATKLLEFWYDRQENCQDAVFEFHGWWNKAEKEVRPPVRWNSKGKSWKKSTVQVTAQSDSSGDAGADIQGPRIKADKQLARNTQSSRNIQVSMDIAVSDDAEESSSDEIWIPMTHKTLVNMPGRTSGKGGVHPPSKITQQEDPERAQMINDTLKPTLVKHLDPGEPTGKSQADERSDIPDAIGMTEPSASRYTQPPHGNHRRVGPASQPAGRVITTLGGRLNAVEKPATKRNVPEKGLSGQMHKKPNGQCTPETIEETQLSLAIHLKNGLSAVRIIFNDF